MVKWWSVREVGFTVIEGEKLKNYKARAGFMQTLWNGDKIPKRQCIATQAGPFLGKDGDIFLPDRKERCRFIQYFFFKLTSFMDAFAKVNITYNNFLLMKHTFIGDYIICILVSFTSTIGWQNKKLTGEEKKYCLMT